MTTLTPFNSRDPVNVAKGGTGLSTYTTGDIIYATGVTTLAKLPIGAEGQILEVSSSLPSWQTGAIPPFDYFNNVYYFEDFYVRNIGGAISTGTAYVGGYGPLKINSTSLNGGETITQVTGKPGIMNLNTQAVSNSNAFFNSGIFILGGGALTLTMLVRIPILSDGTNRFTIRMGLFNNGFSPSIDSQGCYFKYSDTVNSGSWEIRCSDGTATTANTSSLVDTNWHLYQIVVNAAATSVSFNIDGTQVANSPITTHIPTGSLNFVLGITKSLGTTSRSVDIDYFTVSQALTARRY